MPLIWDRQQFERAYSFWVPSGEFKQTHPDGHHQSILNQLHYEREGVHTGPEYHHRADMLLALRPRPRRGDRTLIVGAGHGYLVEVLRDRGHRKVWGLDNSPWIHETKAINVPKHHHLVLEGDVRDTLNLTSDTGNSKFDWVVTESVIESYTVDEVQELFDRCERLLNPSQPLSQVVHLFIELNQSAPGRQDPEYTWLPAEEWKALRPTHTFIQVGGWVKDPEAPSSLPGFNRRGFTL